ncbi:hypothetical protein ASD06_05660, partial [Angustibacter sp. Root456]
MGPWWSQWMRWWAWVQATGAVQPGQVQPRSRSARAMRCLVVKSRRVRPTSRGLPQVSTSTGMISAPHS